MNIQKKSENSIIEYKKKKSEELPIYFTNQELKGFFDSIDQLERNRDYVFFLTLLGTGKRVSEILTLKRNDIDFTNRTIRIISLKKRKKKTVNIRISQKLAYFLSVYSGSLTAETRLFSFTRQYADYLFKKYSASAGINYKRVSCHIFRHTFAIKWLEQGLPIHKLKRHLDHSHINVTMEYLKVVDSDYFQTVDSFKIFNFMEK